MKKLRIAIIALALAAGALAKDPIVWEHAKVTRQTEDTAQGGFARVPLGTSVFTVPITRRTNTIDIETDRYICQWVEDTRKSKGMLVLPVGETINYYQEKGYYILMDTSHKKHYFMPSSMRLKTPQ